MANLKSLQEGGPEVIDETKQIVEALTKMVNEQEIPLEQALMQMFQNGLQQEQAVEVLMSMGYTEDDIQSLFKSMQEKSQPQENQSDLIEDEVEEPETMQQEIQEEEQEQEQPQAKKGKEKYYKGGDFRTWMNRNFGYITDNDKYDVPTRFQSLPTGINRNSGLDFITDMFNVGKRAVNVVKDAKSRINDPSYNKYSIKFGKDANPDDFYITDQSLYEASKTGNLITKDEAKQMMKDKSRIMYDPSSKAYSFALVTNPFESESNIQKQIDKEMGRGYRNRYKEASLPQYEALTNFFKSFIPNFASNNKTTNVSTSNSNTVDRTKPIKGESKDDYNKRVHGANTFGYSGYIWDGSNWVTRKQLGGGTHNTYYGQVGMEYPGTIDQSQFPGFTFGNIGDNTLTFRQWFAQNYGGNLNMTAQSQPELLKQYQNYLDNENAFKGDIFEEPDEEPLQTIQQPDILEPIKNIEPDYTDQEVDAYMNFSKDLSESNLVNKGSMGKQPSVEAQKQLQDAMPKDTSAKVKIKNKGAFSKALDTAADVSGLIVDAGRSVNKLLQDAENLKKYNKIVYGTADEQFSTDIGSKGYWTALDGILSPNRQTEFIGQKGKEMKNFMDYFKMQYGGGNFPQVQQDNTATNMMSEQEAAALANYLSEIDKAKQILSQTQGQIRIPDVNPYFSFLNNQNLPRGANDSMTVDLSQPRDTVDGMNYMNVLYDYDAREQPKFFGRYNQYLNITPNMVRQGRFIPNKQIKNNKMQMGGMNPMSDYFMDNDIPMYQGGGYKPTIYRPTQDLSPDQLNLFKEIINVNDPSRLRNLFNTDGTVKVKSAEFQSLPLDIQRVLAIGSQQIRGIPFTDADFMEDTFEEPKRIKSMNPVIYNTYTPDEKSEIPLTPEQENYIIDFKDQYNRVRAKQQQGPAYQKKYGGDPFMPKRSLRKKKGGQIGNIATQTLKNLMRKYPNFKYSNYED